jgi:hypothetical protein
MVFAWNVQLEGNLGFWMIEEDALGRSEDSLDTKF